MASDLKLASQQNTIQPFVIKLLHRSQRPTDPGVYRPCSTNHLLLPARVTIKSTEMDNATATDFWPATAPGFWRDWHTATQLDGQAAQTPATPSTYANTVPCTHQKFISPRRMLATNRNRQTGTHTKYMKTGIRNDYRSHTDNDKTDRIPEHRPFVLRDPRDNRRVYWTYWHQTRLDVQGFFLGGFHITPFDDAIAGSTLLL